MPQRLAEDQRGWIKQRQYRNLIPLPHAAKEFPTAEESSV